VERIEKIKEYLKNTPEDSFLRHALALEYVKLGDDAQARLLFEAVLAHEPSYIGSYYHLGKLLERGSDISAAVLWYQKGMAAAKAAGDTHAFNELRAACEEWEQ
jgi:Tfp pilus assembly protein PilF